MAEADLGEGEALVFADWQKAIAERNRGYGELEVKEEYDYMAAFRAGRSVHNAARDVREGRQFVSSVPEVVEPKEKEGKKSKKSVE